MFDLFTRSLEQWRPTAGADDGGGGREATAPVKVATLLAKVDQPTAREQIAAGVSGSTLTNVIYFDGLVDVRRGDELRDPDTDEVWDVRSVVRPSEPIYTKANCEQRQTEGEEE